MKSTGFMRQQRHWSLIDSWNNFFLPIPTLRASKHMIIHMIGICLFVSLINRMGHKTELYLLNIIALHVAARVPIFRFLTAFPSHCVCKWWACSSMSISFTVECLWSFWCIPTEFWIVYQLKGNICNESCAMQFKWIKCIVCTTAEMEPYSPAWSEDPMTETMIQQHNTCTVGDIKLDATQ